MHSAVQNSNIIKAKRWQDVNVLTVVQAGKLLPVAAVSAQYSRVHNEVRRYQNVERSRLKHMPRGI